MNQLQRLPKYMLKHLLSTNIKELLRSKGNINIQSWLKKWSTFISTKDLKSKNLIKEKEDIWTTLMTHKMKALVVNQRKIVAMRSPAKILKKRKKRKK